MNSEIILIGGGGHCKSCIDVIEQEGRTIAGIIEADINNKSHLLGYPVIGTDEDLPKLVGRYHCLITVGYITQREPRIRLYKKLRDLNAIMPTIVSPRAYISQHAKIGQGTIIMHGAIVNAGASVGNNCIINSHALIEHDATIEDHCHISTGSIINGGSRIGRACFIGSQTMIREYINIKENSLIGGGMSALFDLPPNSVMKHKKK